MKTASKTALPKALIPLSKSLEWLPATECERFTDDPRGRFTGKTTPTFFPRSTQEVAAIVSACFENHIQIVPYGGGTGVVAGQLLFDAENTILISLEKMNAIRHVSKSDSVMIVEAGCVLADIQAAANEIDMHFPLSMASEGSSQIGGNLATNCGGIQVLRHGNARDLCLGIEAVLPDGSILNGLSPLRKNNTGYDLRHLLIGSEGTLGIITAASLVLKNLADEKTTALCAVSSPESAVQLLAFLRSELGDTVSAFELMCDYGFTVLKKHFPQERFPLEKHANWYVLLKIEGQTGTIEKFQNSLAACVETDLISDAVLASSEAQSDALWRLRELTPEANRLNEAICNSDTAVPTSKIGPFIEDTYRRIETINRDLTINCYGHVGDGNIHFNVFPPSNRSKKEIIKNDPKLINDIRMAINEATIAFHGSISAEHGIGRLKPNDLEIYADPVKLVAMKNIKNAIDPKGIMNPGVMFAN